MLLFLLLGTWGCPQLLDDDFASSQGGAGAGSAGTAASEPVDAAAAGGDDGTCRDGDRDPSEASVDCGGSCPPCIHSSLRHRYGFDGFGTAIVDSVGAANGVAQGTAMTGSGNIVLSGRDDWVSLDDGLLQGLSSVTVESWLVWQGGADWQRVFDFGASTAGDDQRAQGESYLAFTPQSEDGTMVALYLVPGLDAEIRAAALEPLAVDRVTHVAVVADAAASRLVLYVDGQPTAVADTPIALAAITLENAWLGLSQYRSAPSFHGAILEFRVYGAALDAEAVRRSFVAGPDAPFVP